MSENGTAAVSHNISYDSPFLDMTSFYMPKSVKEMFRFIAASIYSDGLVSQSISKLAEYPITKLEYEIKDTGMKERNNKWEEILEKKLNIVNAMKQGGFDYYSYGTSLCSINFPFRRVLRCPKCGSSHSAEAMKRVRYKDFQYQGVCPRCKCKTTFTARDVRTKEYNRISYVFWDLMNVAIKYNNISGDHFFYYQIPSNIKNMIKSGDLDIVNTTRLEIIEAVRKDKTLKLSKGNLFHYKRPGPQMLNDGDRGWGIPVVLPCLKDIFYKKLLRKGNEAIAYEHIVPLRIIFPQSTGDVSPHAMTNLSTWKSKIDSEIREWKKDPNRITIVPFPVGQENFGGDAKLLLVTNEIKAVEDDIITGIGIIPEIIKGGASWSGSNVSLRVVENTFLSHRDSMQEFINWTINSVATYFDIPEISVSMSPFKMADDMQRKTLLLKAAEEDVISKKTAMKEFDIDPADEFDNIIDEVKRDVEISIKRAEGNAQAAGAASVIGSSMQADAEASYEQRSSMHETENREKQDVRRQEMSNGRAEGATGEVAKLEQETGFQMGTTSLGNLILELTSRFASLAKYDKEEFKIRILQLKNTMPNLYGEVYDNLREMNLIEADVAPNMDNVSKYTPGEIPQHAQGEATAEDDPTPSEQTATTDAIKGKDGGAGKPLPEAAPPRRDASPI